MIKIIAFSTMLIDHFSSIYFPDNLILAIIGRLSFPLFAWGIAVGYSRTHSCGKYAARLLILAAISQIPYSMLFNNGYFNICFTLFTGLIVIKIYDSTTPLFLKYLGIFTLLIISHVLRFEYGIYGVLTILLFFCYSNKDYIVLLQGALTIICIFVFSYDPLQLFSVLSPIIIMFLSKYDFKLNRIFQYSFYPAHLLALSLIVYLRPA